MATMTTDQRQRLIAAAERGLKWRRDRLNGWRVILMTMHQVMGHRVTWHDYHPCDSCGHWWDVPAWVGPWTLGATDEEVRGR